MKPYSSKRKAIFLLMLTLVFISLACIFFQPDASSTTTPPSNNPTDKPTREENHTFEEEVDFGSGPVNYLDTTAGLTELSSYKATLILSFEGTNAGQPHQWSKTYVMLTTKEPAARQLILEKIGDLPDLAQVLMAETEGASYERRGENSCIANVITEDYSLAEQMEPAGFLSAIIGADDAGSETVNDMVANHYTFDQRAFGLTEDFAQSTGEMWVAADGGYVLKYLLTTKGNVDYFGEGIEGTLIWDYQLTDINQPVPFTLPDDCPAGLIDAPLLPDAADILNMPSILEYETSSSVTDAAAFYQEQIPSLGWELLGEPAITDTSTILTYTQGDQTMKVIIAADASVTTVTILLGKTQELEFPS